MVPFATRLKVRVSDINYGGHLANERVLGYFHEARVRYLEVLGLSEVDIGGQVSLTQTEAFVSYKGEGFLGDDLEIAASIIEFSRARFKIEYEIVRPFDQKLIATGYTVLAGFDYQTKRAQRIPQSFKNAVNEFQSRA